MSTAIGQRLEFATCRLAEPALFEFLKSITHSEDKEVATDLRRIAMKQPAPFETQLLKSERSDAIELALDRCFIHIRHG